MPYQYPDNIFDAIRSERNDFLYNYVEIVPGYLFSQYELVKRVHLYYNSRFESGQYEYVNGLPRKKIFYNINKWRCDVATKMIDMNTREFRMISTNYRTDWNVFMLEKRLKGWLTRNKMGIVLNEISRKLPIYGTVVIEKTRDGVSLADLRHWMCDQAAPDLDHARYIIKKDFMSPSDLRKMKGVWDNVDSVIDKYCLFAPANKDSYEDSQGVNKPIGTPEAAIYTRYAEVPKSWITNNKKDEGTFVKAKYVVAGIDDVAVGSDGKALTSPESGYIYNEGVVLYKEELPRGELPFMEIHYSKTEGRWIGIGVVEDTFEPQVRTNEVKNQAGKSMELSFKHIYQSTERVSGANVLTDVEEGQVLKSKAEIRPLDTVNRNWQAIQVETNDYEKLADRLTFSYDIIRGEKSPASATATAINEQVSQATSMFDFKRQNFALVLEQFFIKLVVPSFKKETNLADPFRFAGSNIDLEYVRQKLAEQAWHSEMMDSIMVKGRIPSDEERSARIEYYKKQLRKKGNKIWLKAQEDFWKNLEYNMEFTISGESKDTYAQLQNSQAVLTILAKNPDALRNPVMKKVFFKFLSAMGMSIAELEEMEKDLSELHASTPPEDQALGGAPIPQRLLDAMGNVADARSVAGAPALIGQNAAL